MHPDDLKQAAQDVRKVVEAAVATVLFPYRNRSLLFLKPEKIAKDIADLAERYIRDLPDRVRLEPPRESGER